MRLKSFSGLFLMFQLMVNWFCLFIDASSPIHVFCSVDLIFASDISELYLNTCSHILLLDYISTRKYRDEEKCKLRTERLDSENIKGFMKKAKRYPQLKVMLSVWNDAWPFLIYQIRECRENNNSIAIVDSLKEMKFDGMEIRVQRFDMTDTTEDLKHFQKDLKKNGLLFGLTFFADPTGDDWKELERLFDLRLVDFINLDPINYKKKNGLAYHLSPLFKNFPMEHNSRFVAIDDELTQLRAVYQPGKIVIGIPLWGYSWIIPSNVNDTRPPVTVLGDSRLVSYREICQRIQTEGWQVFYEDIKRNISPYAVSPITGFNRTWVSYDDPATTVFKLKYALSNKLGGVYLDMLVYDDSNNTCDLGPDQTLMAIATTLNATLPSTIPTDEVFNRTNITLPSVKVNKNMSIRCHVAFGFGLFVVVSYVIVLIYIFVKCYLITKRKDNLYDDVVVIYENVQPTSSIH